MYFDSSNKLILYINNSTGTWHIQTQYVKYAGNNMPSYNTVEKK